MDSDSQPDKPPQDDFQGLTNILGTTIALVTLITPILSIVSFSTPLANPSALTPSVTERGAVALSQVFNRNFKRNGEED